MFPRPWREDVREGVEIYPTSPRPAIEEVISVAVEIYPSDPRPTTVLGRLVATILLVVEKSCVLDTYPIAPSPAIDERSPEVDTYPTVPRFCCVEKSIAPVTEPLAICARILDVVETSELVVKYIRVDVVDTRERLDTYPAVPRPAVVDAKLLERTAVER